ncbi:MAG: discoidin domain-containing protein [Paludibacter sp.]
MLNNTGWNYVKVDKVVAGRYFCLEALTGQDSNDPVASIAEIELIGENGKKLSTQLWKVIYADSEEITSVNNSADKIFDMQESIIWQTQITGEKAKYPHQVVIDLGEEVKISGVRILFRNDNITVGRIKDYRIYLSQSPYRF